MDTSTTETETTAEPVVEEVETVSLSKSEYEKMNQTLGSLKRELKDLKKPKEPENVEKNQPEDNALLQKLERMSLRQAGLTHQDDVDLAKATAKKWGMDLDDVLADDDFKVKLEKQQTGRDNAVASSNIRGGQGQSQAKNTPEYWIAKGTPPSAADIPDSKIRRKISVAFLKNTTGAASKKFYND